MELREIFLQRSMSPTTILRTIRSRSIWDIPKYFQRLFTAGNDVLVGPWTRIFSKRTRLLAIIVNCSKSEPLAVLERCNLHWVIGVLVIYPVL
jgi:hypothetical protein